MIDQSFHLLACRYLHSQLERLEEELSRSKTTGNIESVHQSRVASRRLRTGLNFFEACFPSRKTKKWLGRIRKLTKKLGMARDRDVQIEFVEEFLLNLDDKQKQFRPGINRLLLRLKQSREKVQPKIVKSVDSFNSSKVLADMHGEIEKILFSLKGRDISLKSGFIFQHAKDRITKQLEESLSHQDSLNNRSDKKKHHQMRISAKRLRYTLEICDVPFEGELKETVKAVKRIQTYLGDIHDCDVWEDYLEEFIAEEKSRTVNYYGHSRSFGTIQKGLDFLRNKCAVRREILFNEFVEFWRKIDEQGLWDNLKFIIDSRLKNEQGPQEVKLLPDHQVSI